MEGNHLGVNVPGEIGKLPKLQGLFLMLTKFSGLIPFSIGNLTYIDKALHAREWV